MQLHERSFGGFRLSPKPPTRWDEGSPSRCSRRKREAQSCQPIPTAVQQYSLTPTASRKSTKTIKSTRLTIRRRTRRIQSKKSPVEKGRFRLAESDRIRNGLIIVIGKKTPDQASFFSCWWSDASGNSNVVHLLWRRQKCYQVCVNIDYSRQRAAGVSRRSTLREFVELITAGVVTTILQN